MDENIAREILDELFSSLETLETQSAAILRFVKDKGLASEQDLAPYFEQAGNASNVRWRAARVRIDHLLASAFKPADGKAKEEPPKPEDKKSANEAGAEASSPTKSHEENEDNSRQKHKEAARAKLEAADAVPASGENPDRPNHSPDNEKENAENNETAKEKQNASGAGTSDSTKKNAA